MTKVYVLMGNDYPAGVFSSQSEIISEIGRRKKVDNEEWNNMNPGKTPPYSEAGSIWYSIYEFVLDIGIGEKS